MQVDHHRDPLMWAFNPKIALASTPSASIIGGMGDTSKASTYSMSAPTFWLCTLTHRASTHLTHFLLQNLGLTNHSERGFWILDFGFWILDFGFWILDFGFWILDFVGLTKIITQLKFLIPHSSFLIPHSSFLIPHSSFL
ncbi:hypothetical protein, partial [Nitratifractor sp.]